MLSTAKPPRFSVYVEVESSELPSSPYLFIHKNCYSLKIHQNLSAVVLQLNNRRLEIQLSKLENILLEASKIVLEMENGDKLHVFGRMSDTEFGGALRAMKEAMQVYNDGITPADEGVRALRKNLQGAIDAVVAITGGPGALTPIALPVLGKQLIER